AFGRGAQRAHRAAHHRSRAFARGRREEARVQGRREQLLQDVEYCRPGRAQRDPGPITTGLRGCEDWQCHHGATTPAYGYGSPLSRGRRVEISREALGQWPTWLIEDKKFRSFTID